MFKVMCQGHESVSRSNYSEFVWGLHMGHNEGQMLWGQGQMSSRSKQNFNVITSSDSHGPISKYYKVKVIIWCPSLGSRSRIRPIITKLLVMGNWQSG